MLGESELFFSTIDGACNCQVYNAVLKNTVIYKLKITPIYRYFSIKTGKITVPIYDYISFTVYKYSYTM